SQILTLRPLRLEIWFPTSQVSMLVFNPEGISVSAVPGKPITLCPLPYRAVSLSVPAPARVEQFLPEVTQPLMSTEHENASAETAETVEETPETPAADAAVEPTPADEPAAETEVEETVEAPAETAPESPAEAQEEGTAEVQEE